MRYNLICVPRVVIASVIRKLITFEVYMCVMGCDIFFDPIKFFNLINFLLLFQGTANKKITFTSQPNSGYPDISNTEASEPGARLVDGPSPVEGRLQIYHHGKWRSVCSNSRK